MGWGGRPGCLTRGGRSTDVSLTIIHARSNLTSNTKIRNERRKEGRSVIHIDKELERFNAEIRVFDEWIGENGKIFDPA